jgi:hypothetical protein
MSSQPVSQLTRPLILVTALLESAVGAALIAAPSFVVQCLLGEGLSSPQSQVLGRIAGAAMISIGASCWFAKDLEPAARRSLVRSLVIYNIAVPAILIYAALSLRLHGFALWPGCVLHSVLSIWCVLCLTVHY